MNPVCRKFLTFLWFAIGLWMHLPTSGQPGQIVFEHFHHEHGLSAPVTQIVQDSFGFLWLGTMDGLSRFDGKNFMPYRYNPADPSSLSNNIINDLCVDPFNRVWAATNGGLCFFDFADGAFHPVLFDQTLEKMDQHRVHAVTNAKRSGMWFATRTLLHHWKENQPVHTYPLPHTGDFIIKCLFEDNHDRVWIGTNQGIVVYDLPGQQFIIGDISTPFSLERNLTVTVHPIVPYDGDTMLIGSWYGGLQKVFISSDNLHSIPLIDLVETNPRKHVIRSICGSADQTWWAGSYGNGLSRYDPRSSTFTQHFHYDPADARSLGDEYVNVVFFDNSGILWVGTNSGLDKYDPLTGQFVSVPIPMSTGEFSVYRLPSSITEDRHRPDWLWITVPGAGLFHFHPKTHHFKLYQHDPRNPYSLPDNSVLMVYYDDEDRMWIGMRSGLSLFDSRNEKFIPAPLPQDNVPQGSHIMLQDKKQNYWWATHSNGIYSYNPLTSRLTAYQYDPLDTNSLPDNRIFCMMEDREGHFWIGTQNRGLCKLDPESGDFTYFRHDKSDPRSLPDNGVYDIYQDPQGLIWVATENGFSCLDPSDFSFTTYTTNDGLSHNDVFTILPDQQRYLWLATNNGLSKFDPDQKSFKNYYINDGLPTNIISGSMCMTSGGTLFFGTMGMISYCHPEKMKMNRRTPPVIVTHFRILDKEVPVFRDGDMLKPIHLSYRENMITFEFSALNFTNSLLNQYAYTLEGFDEQWIYCGTRQSATYTNLDGGTYTFRVKAANNDGLWNEEGTYVTVIMHPPFWRTGWFYVLCAMAVAGILYAIYRFRIHQLLKLQHIRTRISRDLHDDIGSTLSSINMISSMATQNVPEEKKVLDLFQTISSASREAMELMGDIVWSINPKNDRMEMIIIRMRQYASEMLEAAKIPFTLDMEEKCSQLTLPIETRKDFYLIFKEAINNLAKYSNADHATIRLQSHGRLLHLIVSDNGTGFDPLVKDQGNGLKNMQARAQSLKGDLQVISAPGQGTTLTLKIPVSP